MMNKNKIIFLCIAWVLSIALTVGIFLFNYEFVSSSDFEIRIQVVSNINEEEFLYNQKITTSKTTIFEALKELAEKDTNFVMTYSESEYGAYITGLMGVVPNTTGTEIYYWAFYINNAYSSTGISDTTIVSGDLISFELEQVVFE